MCYKANPLDKKYTTNKLIANWCCNQTQAQVLKAINDNGVENHIYCDTDSRIYINNDLTKLTHSKELGGWENEFLVEFVKIDGYDGYCCKIYKNDKVNDFTIDTTKYRIIENNEKYFIFDKYYIMISIAIRQKTYFYGLVDLKAIKNFKYSVDTLLSILNNNNKDNLLNDTDIKYIMSFIVDGYECNDTGDFITNHLLIKKAHSGVKITPTQDELFALLVNGKMDVANKDMKEILCDDGGCYFIWDDKNIDIKRTIKKIDGYDVIVTSIKEHSYINIGSASKYYQEHKDDYLLNDDFTLNDFVKELVVVENVATLNKIFTGNDETYYQPKDTKKIFKGE